MYVHLSLALALFYLRGVALLRRRSLLQRLLLVLQHTETQPNDTAQPHSHITQPQDTATDKPL